MQSLPSRDHGVDVLARDDTLHDDRSVIVILEELLHLCWQLLQIHDAESLGAHRLGESDKVGIVHSGVRVSVLVEEV